MSETKKTPTLCVRCHLPLTEKRPAYNSNSDYHGMTVCIDALLERVREVERQLIDAQRPIVAAMFAYEAGRDDSERQVDRLKSVEKALNKKIVELVDQVLTEDKDHEQKIKTLKDQLDNHAHRIYGYEKEKLRLQAENDALRMQDTIHSRKLVEELETLRQESARLSYDVVERDTRIAELRKAFNNVNNELRSLKAKFALAEKTLIEKTRMALDAKNELGELRREKDNRIETFQRMLDHKDAEHGKEKQRLKYALAEKIDEVAALKLEQDKRDRIIENLRMQTKWRDRIIAELRMQNAEQVEPKTVLERCASIGPNNRRCWLNVNHVGQHESTLGGIDLCHWSYS